MTISALFKKMLPFTKPYKNLIVYTLLLTLVGSFAAQINAFILKYTVDTISTLLVDKKPLSEGFYLLGVIAAVLMGKEVVYTAVQFGQKFYGEKLRIMMARDFSQMVVERILTYRMAFFTSVRNESGKLQTRIDAGISSLTRLVQNFFIDMMPLFANALVALVCMFIANVYVGLVGLLIIPIYFYIAQMQAQRLSGFRRSMRSYRENKSNQLINLIDSITVIKSFVREDLEAERHQQIQYDMTENQMATRKTSFLFDSIKSFIEQIGIVIVIILTAYFVLKGQMSLGAIMFHIMLFNNVSAPIRQLHRIYDEVNDALIYSESFFEVLEDDGQREQTGGYKPEKITGLFEIEGLSFNYPNGHKALKSVNMRIQPNQHTALVGLSGAGKSTVINLLDKFYEPTLGQIRLDGIDLRDYDTEFLRMNIGLVLQRNHIFKGSIADNIRYGKVEASIDEVVEAAKKASIHEQIMDLEQGYDAEAHLLSGGQQQRIAIARMFLKNPPIIFLDEPTANLDAIATEQIKQSLDAIKVGRTVITVSHSISQIIDSEHIIVMEKGTVVEDGTHEELYDRQGTYHKIFSAMANSLNIHKITESMKDN
ncbi:ABC transporter ATP-binding protein [Sphingobacterium sp. MYb382]|uniref:ABC transporter ATP-binding protein n=1 Tax=Sphingobacterium sp. MYb382 TaxID=2745278 RepID=UPI0030A25A74